MAMLRRQRVRPPEEDRDRLLAGITGSAGGRCCGSFRRQREAENVLRAERELADGHASYRFSGYVTVSAAGRDELEADCAEVEQAASRAHLELERLVAQQEAAFAYTLPLCEGLR